MRCFVIFAVLLVGCGVGDQVGTSATALACGFEAIDLGGGLRKRIACAWEQQYANITAHGERFVAPRALMVDGAAIGIAATMRCDQWLLATDEQGVSVFVNTDDGRVSSHGLVHSDVQPSTLPSVLPLPISVEGGAL